MMLIQQQLTSVCGHGRQLVELAGCAGLIRAGGMRCSWMRRSCSDAMPAAQACMRCPYSLQCLEIASWTCSACVVAKGWASVIAGCAGVAQTTAHSSVCDAEAVAATVPVDSAAGPASRQQSTTLVIDGPVSAVPMSTVHVKAYSVWLPLTSSSSTIASVFSADQLYGPYTVPSSMRQLMESPRSRATIGCGR